MNSWWRSDAVAWSSHGWSLELRGDELADIAFAGRPVLRAVRPAVRDHGWLTVPVQVHGRSITEDRIELALLHEGLGAHIPSVLRVTARDAELEIAWDAESTGDFDTCRSGLVVLHPPSDAGSPVTVVHSDGTEEPTAFPRDISAHQPIRDIRELHTASGTLLRFAGDVFEMEDQRNWTDASFKTYSRPLDLPFPYRLEAGERVRQSITLTRDTADAAITPSSTADVVELHEAGAFPEVGVEASTAPDPVPASDAGAFRVVELNLTTPTWQAALTRAAADGLPLDVRLVTDQDAAVLRTALDALSRHDMVRLAAFDAALHVSDHATVAALWTAMEETGLTVPVIAGSRSHFTELNREQHRIARDVAGIAVNTTPLFHTLDVEQLVEAIAMQRLIAEQAVRVADGLPVHVGPVSLRPRFNNVATTPESMPTRTDLAEGYGAQFTGASDERQRAPELAAWLIASAAALAVPGVESLSWFETFGPRGLRDETGAAPAAFALEALAELAGGILLTGASPDGLVWAIGGRAEHEDVVLAANLDRRARRFAVELPAGRRHDVDLAPASWSRTVVLR
jgi:hypothetical protein